MLQPDHQSDFFDWESLGVSQPRAVKLSPEARLRLSHLADLRDIFSPSDARRVGGEYAAEPWLATDLLAVRPWLDPAIPAREVLTAILNTEWNGLLALLGEYGPWVYAASVSDLQVLSGLYGALVNAAALSSEAAVYQSASQQRDFPSLLTRLEATDYRQPAGSQADLAGLELAFWQAAEAQARAHREAWLFRRTSPL